MNYNIEPHSGVPAYMQLYYMLRRDITQGLYPLGRKLPSKRTIAADTSVSVITVEHALYMLCDEGYIESRERSGYYVTYRDSDFHHVSASDMKNVGSTHAYTPQADVPAADSSHFPYGVFAKTTRKVLAEHDTDLFRSSPGSGLLCLRQAISSYLARSMGIYADPNMIIIGSGAEYIYGLIAQLLRDRGIFAIEKPCYDKIKRVYSSFNISFEELPLHKDGIPTDVLNSSNAVVLHVTPFNSYPSGVTVGVSKKHEYLHWAEYRQGYIIEDNYESELTVSRKFEDTVFSMSGGDNVIYINTFSKTIAPSIRVGYMILPSVLKDLFDERLGFYSCTVPVLDQYILTEFIENGDFERHINRLRRRRR